jgi:glycerol kinase
MNGKYILAIDQSTSGTKAILFTRDCTVHRRVTLPHTQLHPRSGWVEHDPSEIAANVTKAAEGVLRDGSAAWEDVAAISLTNQRETGMVWDRETGKPVYNAIVWQCPRAVGICERIGKAPGIREMVFRKTGLPLSPYFTAPKIRWILENVEDARKMADAGRLLFGTVDSWVLWNLTGGKVHATDYSNASRTMLLNIHEMKWDKDLLDLFGIPESMMPELRLSDSIFGYTDRCCGLPGSLQGAIRDGILCPVPDGIPVSGVMGDSHAALFGQNCYRAGMTKATYGTGSSVMMNIGSRPVFSSSGIVTSVGWACSEDRVYVLEGNINCTGRTIQWLTQNLGILGSPRECGSIASRLLDNGGVYFVPAFTGLGAPYWDDNARGIISGLTLDTTREHIIRAAEESIAYQIADITDRMQKEARVALEELRADGGPTRDAFLMQFQSELSGTRVVVPEVEELSALGSAAMAGLAVGFWKHRSEIEERNATLAVYSPSLPAEVRTRYKQGWNNAVRQASSPGKC